jgi:hypothetical protein
MRAGDAPKPRGIRRVERWFVGVVMTVLAFVLEKVVLRAVRKDGTPAADRGPESTTLTSRGNSIDLGS